MQLVGLCCFVLLSQCLASDAENDMFRMFGHHHHHHQHKQIFVDTVGAEDEAVTAEDKVVTHHHSKKHHVETVVDVKQPWIQEVNSKKEGELVTKMKAFEAHLKAEKATKRGYFETGHLLVNGPLPVDFAERFANAAAEATGADAGTIKVTATDVLAGTEGIMSVDFTAHASMVTEIEKEAADSDSKLAKGNLHSFLVAPDEPAEKKPIAVKAKPVKAKPVKAKAKVHTPPKQSKAKHSKAHAPAPAPVVASAPGGTSVGKALDVDTSMPYGDLEPFGREDTAQELTESSVTESDSMVDQLERAEVAEEKRAVFRALTRLRGAAITSFDGVARSQTGNIEEYNKIHQWRKTHPLHHLANEESDVAKWAFPNNADF